MIVVYNLKADQPFIDQVQRATRLTKNFGIEPTDGMFGSDEWWERIESGSLPVQTLKGTIKEVYMGSTGYCPEFKMVSEAGEESRWSRMVHSAEQDRFYRVGARIEIDYVLQRLRTKSFFSPGAEVIEIVAIRIDDSSDTLSASERIVGE